MGRVLETEGTATRKVKEEMKTTALRTLSTITQYSWNYKYMWRTGGRDIIKI